MVLGAAASLLHDDGETTASNGTRPTQRPPKPFREMTPEEYEAYMRSAGM
jgi:hypothetical protein